ncbi:MAG: valine--tRNA ligase [Candidatus Woesearchaeota archaeon]|nr:valine--tRNA ligase [Candidatus Woesearchaeota archaeon]
MADALDFSKLENYDPLVQEPLIQAFWEKNKIYAFNQNTQKEIYSIDTPPPTVSGKMHMGHAFSYSQQDFVARYKRMRGYEVFYPFGTDDNGLATERLIEKMNKVTARKMDRQAFIALCLKTLEGLRTEYVQDWKRIGFSADFSLFYSTINAHSQRISQRSFVQLYHQGRIYQKESPTIWCPQCQSGFAQVELEDVEMTSHFNDIVFKAGAKDLVIGTTRPEMLAACVAVLVNPHDQRYTKLIGTFTKVPLYNHEVPILADEKADPSKGTGVVMCCTFGDQTDVEWWYKHHLPLRELINKDGTLTTLAGTYAGMPTRDARKAIIEELRTKGLLLVQKQITHAVKVHERCGTEIEFLKTKQWFLRYLDLKEQFLEAGSQLNWHPKFMKVRLDHWIQGLQWDWCLSRQRFFGVPIPIWYCKKCSVPVIAEEKDLPVDPLQSFPKKKCACGCKEFIPEKDVLDTWATSSHTPELAVELVSDHTLRAKLFPMSLRPQAHDIITFWLFNTLVKSQLHHQKNPWKDVIISGFALDPHGRKMSKSKGNVVEPQTVTAKYGADALRFWAAGSKLGDDLPYQEKDIVTGKKMVVKLWNAARFAMTHLESYTPGKLSPPKKFLLMDRWLRSKLHGLIKRSTEAFDQYEYSKVKTDVEKFFWHDFCDNYLEIIKGRLYNTEQYGHDSTESARSTLYRALFSILKLTAPLLPFITEAVYQRSFHHHEKILSIHHTTWPDYDESQIDKTADEAGDLLIDIITAVRKAKSDKTVSLGKDVAKILIECTGQEQMMLEEAIDDIKNTTRAAAIEFGAVEKGVKCLNTDVKVGVVF